MVDSFHTDSYDSADICIIMCEGNMKVETKAQKETRRIANEVISFDKQISVKKVLKICKKYKKKLVRGSVCKDVIDGLIRDIKKGFK